jgi:hypothetical protein
MPISQEQSLLAPAPSATGTPVLPVWLAPYVAAITLIAGAVSLEVPEGSTWAKVCRVIVTVGMAYGVVSPGWRR